MQRLRPGSRHLSAPRIVTTRGAGLNPFEWSLVAGPAGRAALIGESDGVTVVTSRRGLRFAEPSALTPGIFGQRLFAGFGGDGRGVALWVEGSNHEQRLRGVPIRADGTVASPRTYVPTLDPRSDFSFFDISAGLDGRSRLTALWADDTRTVRVAVGSVRRRLGRLQVLDAPSGIGVGVADPHVTVAPSGRALATWRRFGPVSAQATMIAIRRSPLGAFRTLPPFAGGSGAVAAILPGGRAVLVGTVGSAPPAAHVVLENGRLGPARSLTGLGRGYRAETVGVVAAAGLITVAWGSRDGLRVATYRPPAR